MRVVITGSSNGIGRECVQKFLNKGHTVFGIDIAPMSLLHTNFTHYDASVANARTLPPLVDVDVLINCAGTQDDDLSIQTNLMGVINCTEKYALHNKGIRAVVNIASASAHSGAEFPRYAASKGGVVTYTKWTADKIAPYGATCNSVSPGGVLTESNAHILNSPELMITCLKETMLHAWSEPSEIAEWVYFLATKNKSMTAQDLLIDNGEMAKFNFVW